MSMEPELNPDRQEDPVARSIREALARGEGIPVDQINPNQYRTPPSPPQQPRRDPISYTPPIRTTPVHGGGAEPTRNHYYVLSNIFNALIKTVKVVLILFGFIIVGFYLYLVESSGSWGEGVYRLYAHTGHFIISTKDKVVSNFSEEPSYDPAPPQLMVVKDEVANIRMEPKPSARVLYTVYQGQRLHYQNEYHIEDKIGWLQVITPEGETGWILRKPVEWDEEANERIEAAAKKGNIEAMMILGYRNEYGFMMELSEGKAFKWYKKAADLGDARAQLTVGWFYEHGKGEVWQNDLRALHYYELSAEQGNIEAMNNIGTFYMAGKIVEQDHQEAMKYFNQVLEKDPNQASTLINLASVHYLGVGVEKNFEKAMELYRQAASLGDSDAEAIVKGYEELEESEFHRRLENHLSEYQSTN